MSTYGITLIGLRAQARYHGIDPNLEFVAKFLNHTAELIEQAREQAREANSTMHKQMAFKAYVTEHNEFIHLPPEES